MSKSIRTLLFALVAAQPISARAEPLETFQLKDRIDVAGQALGTSRFYKVTTSASRTVLFSVTIDPSCHYTLQKGAVRDIQPHPGKVPIEFSDKASVGDVYIFSFSQTRSAWQASRPCAYSFSLQ
ncbi:hypothetical protein FHX08_005562 [Rhizobium sp. BK529]|uniref:hypothetical protein n=1 Tax=Rhizobium sp. BK529 TaxID=2586983 RepID=UPI001607D849|nr:hypothetical protein [Rhizobium sp. BK529]MBB3595152.1 hypothetical protein [Rhizobium sp. BK529]